MSLKELFEKHQHWQDILAVVRKLTCSGHKVVLAGGCVRDALLGQTPHDFDIATSATPDEVLKLFTNGLSVGKQFGVIILPYKDFQIEIATFRYEDDYKDGRHPEVVGYTKDPRLDAKRRDFTVNALFYDFATDAVIDHVSGLEDLKAQVLRTVGNPQQRFSEDKLRLLRAARFAAQLGFQIEINTLKAISELAAQINQVSKERITEEFKKLAKTKNAAAGFVVLKNTGLLQHIWPDLTFIKDDTHWSYFLRILQLIAPVRSFELMVATLLLLEKLFQESENKNTSVLQTPFLLSRELKKHIDFLVHGFSVMKTNHDETLLLLNDDLGPLLTELCHNFAVVGLFSETNLRDSLERFLAVADERGVLPEPFLTGEDLKALGVKPSPRMGELLKTSYMAQIRGELKNKKEAQDWVLLRVES